MLYNRYRHGFIKLSHEREKEALRIVADGAIAHPGIGEGKLIPLIILDTSSRADVEEYIRVHQYVAAGDVTCQWGQVIGHDNTVALILSVLRPATLVIIVEFDLRRHHGFLIEQVLSARALYIQAGREGDRLKNNLNLPKVILEVPDTGFGRKFWDAIHLHYTVRKMCERGLNRADAKRAAKRLSKRCGNSAASAWDRRCDPSFRQIVLDLCNKRRWDITVCCLAKDISGR